MIVLRKFSISKINLKNIIATLVLVIALFFLIAHTLNWTNVTIDTTSLLLLILILLIPFVDLIRKIKYGDFEAEISSKEVQQTINKVNDEFPTTLAHAYEFGEEILELVKSDSQLGLAKLRFEFEKSIKRIINLRKNQSDIIKYYSFRQLTDELNKLNVVPHESILTLKGISNLTTRAIHGEYIKDEDAIKIAQSGIKVLNTLNEIYQELAYKPIEKTTISMDDVESYEQAKYRVTTIIPYVENPIKNVYIWDRDTLYDFLADSGDFAEVPISIEKIDEKDKTNNSSKK